MLIQEFINGISNGSFDAQMRTLYGKSEKELLRQKVRYMSCAEKFSKLYPENGEVFIFSSPARTEVGGNHTDRQHGCVLASAVNLDIIAFASPNDDNVIRVRSEGYRSDEISLDKLDIDDSEKGTSASLIRGIASAFIQSGTNVKGFNVYAVSEINSGCGLSSSSAFEVLITLIIDNLFNNGESSAEERARIAQFAENVYFGKPTSLMNQMVCSVGGFVCIDFYNPSNPSIEPVRFDFSESGYSLCITDTKSTDTDFSEEYISISEEMRSVATALGRETLRDADEDEFYFRLPELRRSCSDRAILRTAHFFAENRRVTAQAEALEVGDTEEFFRLMNESGESSAIMLQNLYSSKSPENQQIPLAIMLSKRRLGGSGAVRVHGNGFAGAVQAFVPTYLAEYYADEMNAVFGENSCQILNIRPVGAVEIKSGE